MKKKDGFLEYLGFCAFMLFILIVILHDHPLSETAKFMKPATVEIIREYPLGIKTSNKINIVDYKKDVIRIYRKALQKTYYYVILVKDNNNKVHPLFLTPFCIKKTDDFYCEDLEYTYNNINKFFHSDMHEYVINSKADTLSALIAVYWVGSFFLYINLRLFIFNKKLLRRVHKLFNTN